MIEISNRLEKIASYVEKNNKVADIGTDHGFVPNFLIREELAKFVIASDISKNSLEKSIENTIKFNNEDKIEHRVGAGLKVLEVNEVDVAIIAGMGGLLISEIIEDSFDIAKKLDKLILQPMQAKKELRIYLKEKKFKILDEAIIYEDGKYFEIIVAKYLGEESLFEDIYLEIPKTSYVRRDAIIKQYLENRIEYSKILVENLCKSSNKELVNEKILEKKQFIKDCEELLNDL